MNTSFNENKTLYMLLGIILVLLLAAFYYFTIFPKIERKGNLQQSVEITEAENASLENRIAALLAEEEEEVNTFSLRKKLPEQRQIKELLLAIHQAELISEAKMQSIRFNNYDSIVKESSLGPDETETSETEETTTTSKDELEDLTEDRDAEETGDDEEAVEEKEELIIEDMPKTVINRSSLPDALKFISFVLEVDVQDYDHLLLFLQEIEEIERIQKIELVAFTMSGEEDFAQSDFDEGFTVEVQVTTFYAEDVGA